MKGCVPWARGPRAKALRLLGAAALLCVASLAHGQQQGKFVWEEFGGRVESARTVTALGSDLLGDSISLANCELSFDATDVSIPGNGSLPVEVPRSYKVLNRKEYFSDKAFADRHISLRAAYVMKDQLKALWDAHTAKAWRSAWGSGYVMPGRAASRS